MPLVSDSNGESLMIFLKTLNLQQKEDVQESMLEFVSKGVYGC